MDLVSLLVSTLDITSGAQAAANITPTLLGLEKNCGQKKEQSQAVTQLQKSGHMFSLILTGLG